MEKKSTYKTLIEKLNNTPYKKRSGWYDLDKDAIILCFILPDIIRNSAAGKETLIEEFAKKKWFAESKLTKNDLENFIEKTAVHTIISIIRSPQKDGSTKVSYFITGFKLQADTKK